MSSVVTTDTLGSGEFGQRIGPANCSAKAQFQGGPLGIQNVRRGKLRLTQHPTLNYSVSSTTFAEVDTTNLAGEIDCSGRPLRIEICGFVLRGTTVIQLSVTLDGTEVTGSGNGMAASWSAAAADHICSFFEVTPTPGRHRLALVAKVDAGTGTIFAGANVFQLRAIED